MFARTQPGSLVLLFALILPLLSGSIAAQDAEAVVDHLLDGGKLSQLFKPMARRARTFTVEISGEDDVTSLGIVIGAEGRILTKSSSLPEEPKCLLYDDRMLPAKVIARDEDHDIALLEVDAEGLIAAVLAPESPRFAVGQWLVTAARESSPVRVGVLSVLPRMIADGFLGVSLEQVKEGSRVARVESDSAAERAGVLVGDIITGLGATTFQNRERLIEAIGSRLANSKLEIQLLREGKSTRLSATLGRRPEPTRSRRGPRSRGLSKRRSGFPMVFQHDTVVSDDRCGGAVVDLDGRVVGMNIARAGRTQTLAIPVTSLVSVIARLEKSVKVSKDGGRPVDQKNF